MLQHCESVEVGESNKTRHEHACVALPWLCSNFALRLSPSISQSKAQDAAQNPTVRSGAIASIAAKPNKSIVLLFCRHCVGVLHAAVSLIRCATNREWACRSLGFSACTHCVGRPAVPGTTWTAAA